VLLKFETKKSGQGNRLHNDSKIVVTSYIVI